MSNDTTLQKIIDNKLVDDFPLAMLAPTVNLFRTSALGGACFAVKGSACYFTIGMNTSSPINKIINMRGEVVCTNNTVEFFDYSLDGAFTILPLEPGNCKVGTVVDFIDSLGIDVCLGYSQVSDDKFRTLLYADKEKAKDFETIISKIRNVGNSDIANDVVSNLNVIAIKVAKGVLFIRENGNRTMDIVIADDKMTTTMFTDLPHICNLNMIMLIMSILAVLSPIQENSNQ